MFCAAKQRSNLKIAKELEYESAIAIFFSAKSKGAAWKNAKSFFIELFDKNYQLRRARHFTTQPPGFYQLRRIFCNGS
jgi:hypothetical protein